MNEFMKKWCGRHSHPANAVLHAVGIPMTMVGGTMFFYSKFLMGILFIVIGYILQVIGHTFEGSEVGELMLIKHIIDKLSPSKRSK